MNWNELLEKAWAEEEDKKFLRNYSARVVHIAIKSWRDYFRLYKVFAGPYSNYQWAFRGQKEANWGLKSSLERDIDVNGKNVWGSVVEHEVIREFRDLAKLYGTRNDFGSDKCDVEILATMQHYGSHTRMIDFSLSFAVATYFAFEGVKEINSARSVWAINLDMLLARCKTAHQRLFSKSASNGRTIAEIVDKHGWPHNFTDVFREQLIQIAEETLRRREGEWHNEVLPIRVIGCNARLAAQNGIFLFPTSREPFEKQLANTLSIGLKEIMRLHEDQAQDMAKICTSDLGDAFLIKIDFLHEMDDKAREMLKQLNVTAKMIYPDLEGVAKDMRFV